jgi:hypothetical protein
MDRQLEMPLGLDLRPGRSCGFLVRQAYSVARNTCRQRCSAQHVPEIVCRAAPHNLHDQDSACCMWHRLALLRPHVAAVHSMCSSK